MNPFRPHFILKVSVVLFLTGWPNRDLVADEQGLRTGDKYEIEQAALRLALKSYLVDYDRLPQNLYQLTTPILYLRRVEPQEVLPHWDYIVDASGAVAELRNLNNADYTLRVDIPFRERVAQIAKEEGLLTLLELGQQEQDSWRRLDVLNACSTHFFSANFAERDAALAIMQNFLSDGNSRVRSTTLHMLGYGSKEQLRALMPSLLILLDDASSDVRYSAIRTLRKAQEPALLPKWLELLSDADSEVRLLTVHAVADCTGVQAWNALESASQDPAPSVRSTAVSRLADRKEPGSLEVLLAALNDKEQRVRIAGIQSLARFPGERTREALLAQFDRENESEARREILRSLQFIGALGEAGSLADAMSVEEKVTLVEQDMRQLATGFESWYVDRCAYPVPDEAFEQQSLFRERYGIAPEVADLLRRLPPAPQPGCSSGDDTSSFAQREQELYAQIQKLTGEENWLVRSKYGDLLRNRLWYLNALTTPVAYLRNIPHDPFHADFTGRYRYGTDVDVGRDHPIAGAWVLVSDGPDEDKDIDPAYVVINVLGGENRSLLYTEYPFEGLGEPLLHFVYDPTNGTLSSGDIVRFGP